jgi:hypothetical protein
MSQACATIDIVGGGTASSATRVTGIAGVEGFAAVARRLADAARATGLRAPAFRSPPRIPGAARSLRRYPGGAVVSVRLHRRPLDAVIADMVEGVIVANRLSGEAALRARTFLAESVADLGSGAPAPGGGVASDQARVVERQTRAA